MALASYNTRLYYDADGSGTYTEVTGVRNIELPELSATAVAADGLTDLYKLTVPGKIDCGDVTAEILFDKTQYAALFALHRVTPYSYRVQYPDATPVTNGSKIEFTGYLRSISAPSATEEGDSVLVYSIMVKVNATPVFTPGS